MEESRIDRLECTVIFLILGLLPLHLYLSFSNLVNGIEKGYGHSFPIRSYVWIGIYLLIVLASDAFMLRYRKFEASKELRRYWGSACIALIVVVVFHFALDSLTGISFLCLLYAPFMVLVPILELLRVPVQGDTSLYSFAAVGTFCLVNWAICRFAVREKREEETP